MSNFADETEKRCQGIAKNGAPCRKIAEYGDFCASCNRQGAATERRRAKNLYELGQHTARVNEFAGDDHLKALNGEIGILRRTLEAMFLECPDAKSLAIKAKPIGDMAEKIAKLVVSCHQVEEKLGGLLDKTRVTCLAEQILGSVTQRATDAIPDEEVRTAFLRAVGQDIVEAIK